MKNLINRLFSVAEYIWAKKWLNLWKTIYINFRLLPIRQAIRLPIYIYGPVAFNSLAGKAEFNTNSIFRGMVKLGVQQGCFTACKKGAAILIAPNAKIIFNGPCSFDYDYVIRITGHGIFEVGAFSGFGSDIKILCNHNIKIGDYCRIAFNSIFMDTNYHYTINTDTNVIYSKEAPISIGNYNWIGNSCTIMKGTKTSDHTIISSRSFLNKDYSKELSENESVVLAGSPASIVGKNIHRIYNPICEMELNEWFANHLEKKYIADSDFANKCIDLTAYTNIFK